MHRDWTGAAQDVVETLTELQQLNDDGEFSFHSLRADDLEDDLQNACEKVMQCAAAYATEMSLARARDLEEYINDNRHQHQT